MSHSSAISYLFVPGTRPDRFERALESGAGRVIIDWEDAVAATDKSAARQLVLDAVATGLSSPVLIRLNSFESPWIAEDLAALSAALRSHRTRIAGVVIPKIESASEITQLRSAIGSLDQLEVIGLVESATGVDRVDELASAGVTRLAVGAVDLSVDLGSDVESPLLDHVYSRMVIASRLAGIAAPLGSPPLDFRNLDLVETSARRLKSMGISGQLCIHPTQVVPIHAGFAPTEMDVSWARRVLESEGASAQVDGQMVDKPVRDRAERIIHFTQGLNQ